MRVSPPRLRLRRTSARSEGLIRHELGREKFLERVWDWKHKYGNRIISQLKKLGSSCDWERERFTMDEGCSKAVKEVFVNLYKKGLIYKGHRIINWCPHCATALSDAEVEYETQPANCGTSAIRLRMARAISSLRPPVRRPSWAIPALPSTRTTSATGI